MSGAVKMEGFQPSSNTQSGSPSRPIVSRPFSDGSMTVDSSILSSLMGSGQPFSFGSSLPSQSVTSNPFDYNMVSPQSAVIDLPSGTSPHSFQPHSMFGHLNFGAENREPPVLASPVESGAPQRTDNRSRSQSSSRSSHIGKAPAPRSRSGRKLSMNDVKPNMSANRGRTMQPPPRSMSFQTDSKPSLVGLSQRTNSITSPEYAFEQQYGIAIPRSDFGRSLWGGGSAPSALPDSMNSYGASLENDGLQSPVTPAQNVQQLLGDESRKQRRRECHNQVEKRRREHINAMIDELNKLLPPRFKLPTDADIAIEDDEDDDPQESPVKKKKSKRQASTSKSQKDAVQCKGRILSDSVQYIRDLQTVNEQQSSRIRYLESLLMSNGQQGSSSWPADHGAAHHDSTGLPPELEAMRASPEAEHLVPLQSGWNAFSPPENTGFASNSMLVFEPSPTEASSGRDQQRSTPLSSGSPETADSKEAVVWGLMDLAEERTEAALPPPRNRKDSQYELQTSMGAMELDVNMDDRRSWPNF